MTFQSKGLSLLSGALLFTGCAGPTTPLGAVKSWLPSGGRFVQLMGALRAPGSAPDSSPTLHFLPARQILHGPHPLTIVIEDPEGIAPNFDFRASYNDFDVTSSLLSQAKIRRSSDSRKLLVSLPSLRLPPSGGHSIAFYYRNSSGGFARAPYGAPVCDLSAPTRVRTLDFYRPPSELIAQLEQVSLELGYNPTFTAGLVAKESAFLSNAVSWARAIGLMQITPMAERSINERVSRWPRFPELESIPVPVLKSMVWSGQIHPGNEWRLDPEKSLRGGLALIEILDRLWSAPDNSSRVLLAARTAGEEPAGLRTRLVLASYNSGYARVSSAFRKNPGAWSSEPELAGIDSYINKIVSACDHFSQAESGGENEEPT